MEVAWEIFTHTAKDEIEGMLDKVMKSHGYRENYKRSRRNSTRSSLKVRRKKTIQRRRTVKELLDMAEGKTLDDAENGVYVKIFATERF